jgi:signal recognition particle GTPase
MTWRLALTLMIASHARACSCTHVLSFINLKGGVGKTTTAVAVAEILTQEDRKHVLLVDLDPQTNATVTVISEDKWRNWIRKVEPSRSYSRIVSTAMKRRNLTSRRQLHSAYPPSEMESPGWTCCPQVSA